MGAAAVDVIRCVCDRAGVVRAPCRRDSGEGASVHEGADYLLNTQLEDGTWFVRTRAFGFQPYLETGFPYERSQFISTAATAWATTALTYTLSK